MIDSHAHLDMKVFDPDRQDVIRRASRSGVRRIHCPYLAPEPHRGKRSEPVHVWTTARALAGVRASTIDEIERVTEENFDRLFARRHTG